MPNSIKTHEKNSIEIFKNKNFLNSNINKKIKDRYKNSSNILIKMNPLKSSI